MDMVYGWLPVSPVTAPTCKTKVDFHTPARSHRDLDTQGWAKRNGAKGPVFYLAEREGFEPSMEVLPPYALSRGAPSTTRPSLLKLLIADSGEE